MLCTYFDWSPSPIVQFISLQLFHFQFLLHQPIPFVQLYIFLTIDQTLMGWGHINQIRSWGTIFLLQKCPDFNLGILKRRGRCSQFLSSAYLVRHGLKSQKFIYSLIFLSICIQFSRLWFGWSPRLWQGFWRTAQTGHCHKQCRSLAMPHPDFLDCLSSATLNIFISGVSCWILML